jgi:hypothetical protein
MKNTKLLAFSIITLIVIVAAIVVVNSRAPITVREKGVLFPDLASQINDINTIRIRGYEDAVTLKKKGDNWVIEEFEDYPALFDKIKQTIIGISELKVIATKTSRPNLYSRLGVEGVDAENSTSTLITLDNNKGEEAAALIVGKPRRSKSAINNPGLYVRKPQEIHSLLVEGSLDISSRITSWFERTIFDIPSRAIKEIVNQHADGDMVRISRTDIAQDDFQLQDIPEGKKVAIKIILNRMGTLLETFHVSRAKAASNFTFPEDAHVTTVRMFGGMVATIKSTLIDDVAYANFTFDYDPEQAADESTTSSDESLEADTSSPEIDFAEQVAILNKKLSGWVFIIPEFKYELLAKRMNDLIRPDNPKAPVNVNEAIEMFTPGIQSIQ